MAQIVDVSSRRLQGPGLDLYYAPQEVQPHGELLTICECLSAEDQLSENLHTCRQAIEAALPGIERAFRSNATKLYRYQASEIFAQQGSRAEHLD